MQTHRRSLTIALLIAGALTAKATARPPEALPATPLPLATPESQGLSKERLARLHAGVQGFVDEGKHAGAITLIARNRRIVDWQTYGQRDLEAGLPMEKVGSSRRPSRGQDRRFGAVGAAIFSSPGATPLPDCARAL